MDIRKELVYAGANADECGECMCWAVGDNWGFMPWGNIDNEYRSKHPDCEPIYGATEVGESARIIVKEYLREKNGIPV